jgi:hypothetical protein
MWPHNVPYAPCRPHEVIVGEFRGHTIILRRAEKHHFYSDRDLKEGFEYWVNLPFQSI